MAIPPDRSRTRRPRGVLVIAAVLVLEALASAALAFISLATIVTGDPVSLGGSVFMVVLLVAVAAGLVALASKLASGFRWARSPTLVVQLFLVILAFPYFTIGNPLFGFALLVPAAAVIVALFSKPVVDFTARVTGPERTL